MAKSYIEYLKEILSSQENAKKQQISASDSEYGLLKAQVKSEQGKKKGEIDSSYGALVDAENVKRLINERKINEAAANMGLTDSGLNRTQQTASQLSHSNRVSGLFAQRRAQVDALKHLTDMKLQELEEKRLSKNADIEQGFLDTAQKVASELYNADLNKDSAKREYEMKVHIEDLEKKVETYEKTLKQWEKKYGILTDEELNGDLSPSRPLTVEELEATLLTRKQVSDERKINPDVTSYEDYLRSTFYEWLFDEKIAEPELEYLMKKYNLKQE